ncbi:MAG TPA: GerMN domain-containing protein [Spirochaetota bacterium]|nr:GerMN domain-containing protein [Spirochaetota bacterium]HNT10112.1 GerMN domain-containing protein [Spirochaetota bacterium]
MNIAHIKQAVASAKDRIVVGAREIRPRERIARFLPAVQELIEKGSDRIPTDATRRNRLYVLVIALICLFDYLAISYLTDRNPLAIYPSLPVLDSRATVTVYLPNPDGKTLIKETRRVEPLDDREEFARTLVKLVARGSDFENTSFTVPVDVIVRKVWIHEERCAVDIALAQVKESMKVLPGSEVMFRQAVAKTITENIPSVKIVHVLEKGIPNRNIWEMGI